MAYVITQTCCNDASCVAVCPVDCIRPSPEDREAFLAAEMLYIDPQTCIDCGACVDACPVNAIYPQDELPANLSDFADINARFFQVHPLQPAPAVAVAPRPHQAEHLLTVAIVGAGPSAWYLAEELLTRGISQITIFEALPTPWGLLRSGVAPDHADTKALERRFRRIMDDKRVSVHLNVTVGRDVTVHELSTAFCAVVFATGASAGNGLDVAGLDLPGVHHAAELVAWYNGHPSQADLDVNLATQRAVIIGNGNVALDVARMLARPVTDLATTDIADHALHSLAASEIREVVVVGRRGPSEAAYTFAEFRALGKIPGVSVEVRGAPAPDEPTVGFEREISLEIVRAYRETPGSREGRRLVFRYFEAPTSVLGIERVEGVELASTELVDGDQTTRLIPGSRHVLATGLVVLATGFRARPIPGVPFDTSSGTIPNQDGRLLVDESAKPGLYVIGWAAHGASGGLGSCRIASTDIADRIVRGLQCQTAQRPHLRPSRIGGPSPDSRRDNTEPFALARPRQTRARPRRGRGTTPQQAHPTRCPNRRCAQSNLTGVPMTHVLTTYETSKPGDLGTRVVIAACLVALATCASACSSSPLTKTATSRAQTSKPEPSTSPASPSTQSSRVGGDAADITGVYQRFFNVKTPVAISASLLQDGAAFTSYLAAQAKSPASHGLGVTVSKVVVNSPNKATVTFSLLLNGNPVLANQTGYAVREAGQWKVAGDTYCGLLAAQGAPPPMCSTPAVTALPS